MQIAHALVVEQTHFYMDNQQHALVRNPDEIADDGMLVLWGGADISPSIYGQNANSYVYTMDKPTSRDASEMALVRRAIDAKRPIIGICRGAQLLCAMAGGKLVQHVTNHAGRPHTIKFDNQKVMSVNSLHHQMMDPRGVEHVLLASASPQVADAFIGEFDEEIEMENEPEIVYFPQMKALAVQCHPEYFPKTHQIWKYINSFLKKEMV